MRVRWIALGLLIVIGAMMMDVRVGRSQDDLVTPTPDFDAYFPAGSSNRAWSPLIEEFNGIPFVQVPAGCFMMGSTDEQIEYVVSLGAERDVLGLEQPAHKVCLSEFWIMQTEVTNAMYKRCVAAGACAPPGDYADYYYDDPAYADHPIVAVNWQQSADFATWLNGTLPTEAQWEYAARGPEGWIFPWGDESDGNRLNFCDVNCGFDWNKDGNYNDGYALTSPAGSYIDGASWVGALDMSGNVWEWTADRYSKGYYGSLAEGVLDPAGPSSGWAPVWRGGAFNSAQFEARAASRSAGEPSLGQWSLGFRVVVSGL